LAIDKKAKNYNRAYSVVGVERSSESVSSEILRLNPDIIYWRFNKRLFYNSVKKVAGTGVKIIFAVSNIKDLYPYGSPMLKGWTLRDFKSYLKKITANRYNFMGFRYVAGITTNNKDHLHYSPVVKKKYIPNAITDEIIPFTWNKPYVSWIANIKKRKRPEIYVDVAKHFENRGIDFLMVGKIADDSYDWLSHNENLPSNLHYLGTKTVEEVNGILKNSLILITTSTPEGFSNNLIQAWLQRKPTISFEFDPGGLIEQEGLGYVCKSEYDLFLNKIDIILNNSTLREQIGNRAGNFADNYFSKKKTIDLIESFMLEIYEN
jgi:glycosyltransferase involved in cell wall biosynthesis